MLFNEFEMIICRKKFYERLLFNIMVALQALGANGYSLINSICTVLTNGFFPHEVVRISLAGIFSQLLVAPQIGYSRLTRGMQHLLHCFG